MAPTYQDLHRLVQKYLPNQYASFGEKEFQQFFEEYFRICPLPVSLMSNEEKRLENCIKQSIAEWSWWNQLRLKRAIETFKPKIQQWLLEKEQNF
jgi:hypothetical protein